MMLSPWASVLLHSPLSPKGNRAPTILPSSSHWLQLANLPPPGWERVLASVENHMELKGNENI